MSDKPQDLSFFDPSEKFGPENYESHVRDVDVIDNNIIVKKNIGEDVNLGQYRQSPSVSIENIEISNNVLTETFLNKEDVSIDLELRDNTPIEFKYNGVGFLREADNENLTFEPSLSDNFSIQENEDNFVIEIENLETAEIPPGSLLYERYAMFSNATIGNAYSTYTASGSGGSTVALPYTVINNIANDILKLDNSSFITLAVGTYWVKLTTTYFAASGARLAFGRSSVSVYSSSSRYTEGVHNVTGFNTVTMAGKITVTGGNQPLSITGHRISGTAYLGGGDSSLPYNNTIIVEIWKL